jgi:hypothetical protein
MLVKRLPCFVVELYAFADYLGAPECLLPKGPRTRNISSSPLGSAAFAKAQSLGWLN